MLCLALCLPLFQDHVLFDTQELTNEFFAEGAHFGDLDGDGANDVIVGPFWYAGPEFSERHRYRAGEAFDTNGYSVHFFTWTDDIDGDGRLDILRVGFPGVETYWYENPGEGDAPWPEHLIWSNTDNESPQYMDVVGDAQRELVFHTGGRLVWCAPGADPRAEWEIHVLSTTTQRQRFTHGLGVGDVNGDGRNDVLLHEGWWEQPASLDGDPLWTAHPFRFGAGYGGAQMLVSDVDEDGDGDVITSLNAHGYGLSWFENTGDTFVEHPVMGTPDDALADGWAVSELHALALCDVDGDGVDDFVTGKRYMSHGFGEAGARDPAHILWFRCVRDAGGVRFEPNGIHDASGVGTQVTAGDVNGDGRVDFVTASKHGAYVHLQRAERGARPERRVDERFPPGGSLPVGDDGRALNLDFEAGDLRDWTATGDAFAGQPVEGDTVHPRRPDSISHHAGDFWIGTYEVAEDGPQGRLTSVDFELTAPFAAFLAAGGNHDQTCVQIVRARDGKVLAQASGANSEELRPVVVDLTAHVGEQLRIVLIDEHSGGWGHINFDHFQLYAERPNVPGEFTEALRDVVVNAGLAPQDAAAAMEVPEGFRVDLVAAEPDIHQPIAFALDERGRIWVAEAFSYPIRRPDDEARDRIVILEDADGDGTFETHKTFIEGLNLVSGLELGFGGVWVGAAPYLYFIPDRDGDDVPDGEPEVLLDGWGYEDTHETLNAFIWGPDGWLYGCHGVFTHSKVGKPGTPDDERTKINAGVWRYHPTRHTFEVFAWGTSNPWGVDFDDYGEAFVSACVIPHFFHLVQGGRYQRQAGSHFNPYVFEDIETIADHRHFVGEWAHGGNGRSNSVGGGHAHCGLMIYLGDSFPQDEYRGAALFNNVHGNRVNHDRLVPAGASHIAQHGEDFLLANDEWFRGINLKSGPAGEVYLSDWYDPRACHGTDPEVWDRSNGRLYRVSYAGATHEQVDLRGASEAQLIDMQMSNNEWDVRMARRLLQERGVSDWGATRLAHELLTHVDVRKRLRAMWALHVVGAFTPELAAQLKRDSDDRLEGWAVRLLQENGYAALDVWKRFMVEAGPLTTRAYASSLQRLEGEERWTLAHRVLGLAFAESTVDNVIALLTWYGIEPLVAEDPARALRELRSVDPRLNGFVQRRVASDAAGREALFEQLLTFSHTDTIKESLEHAITALGDRRGLELPASWPPLYESIAQIPDAELQEKGLILAAIFGDPQAFPELRERLANGEAPLEERRRALDALERAKDPAAVPLIVELLDAAELRGPALKALAGFADPRAAQGILARWEHFEQDQRTDAIATLTSRADSAVLLLGAMRDGAVDSTLLTAFDLRKLRTHDDGRVNDLIDVAWGQVRDVAEDAAATIAAWQAKLTEERLAAADLSHGRAVFAQTCLRCHTLYGVGEAIGPDITGSNRADLGYLLTNMIDPSAEVPKEYRMTIVATHDGRIVNGILQRETDDAIVLRTENDTVTLGKDEIDARKLDENSMMPVGQLDTLSEDEVAALVAYLRHDAQVPQRMTADDVLFDGESLARWTGDPELWSVEDGVIIGRSPGTEKNVFLISDFDLGDFRLVVDVHLGVATENSGIQFRSRTLEGGDVAGYQADIGKGWWGTLYDEHGRGQLAANPRDDLVTEWTTYEVLAVGDRIQTALNGTACVDFTDPEPRPRGVLALQMHSGGPFEVRFRNLRLELDPEPQLSTVTR